MYMDGEQPYTMNAGGKMIEIWEHKYGFIPGQEQITSRSRRRFRLAGKNPNDVASSLWLLFYSRTGEETRVQANPMQARPQPIRKYPLPALTTKPFNLFQAITGGAQMPNHQQQMQQQYQMHQMQQMQQMQQAQQAQAAAAMQAQQIQNQQRQIRSQTPQQRPAPTNHHSQNSMSALPGYSTPVSQVPQKRAYPGNTPSTVPPLPAEVASRLQRGEVLADTYEESTGDEFDSLHPIDISRARFIQHQDWLEQIFSAYSTSKITAPKLLPSDVTEESLKSKIESNQNEIDALKASHAAKIENIRNPEGLQGRLQAAITKLSTDEFIDADTIQQIENDVGLKTVPWSKVRKSEIMNQ